MEKNACSDKKKSRIKVLSFIVISILITNLSVAEQITLNTGELKELNGNILKLKSVKIDKAVVSVNDESKIIVLDKEEIIGAVKVKLLETFYITSSEGNAKLEVTSLYTCGDAKCEGPETKKSCCQDCGCPQGYDCEDKQCLIHVENECNSDEDCDDNNQNTIDKCTGRPKKCQNSNILICTIDKDCDDERECTKDSCVNNDCFNEEITGCKSNESVKSNDEKTDEKTNVVDEQEGLEKQHFSLFERILNFFSKLFERDS